MAIMKLTFNSTVLRLLCLFVLATPSTVASQTKCFVSDGLKNSHTVKMTITGRSLSGVYIIEEYDSTSAKRRRYSGRTRDGVHWKIKFHGGGAPYELPPGTREIVWRRGKRGKREAFVIRMYGKNYETNRYVAYDATFEACKKSK